MPLKGYTSITLNDDVVSDIDSLIDVENDKLKNRARVVTCAVANLKRGGQ